LAITRVLDERDALAEDLAARDDVTLRLVSKEEREQQRTDTMTLAT